MGEVHRKRRFILYSRFIGHHEEIHFCEITAGAEIQERDE